MFSLSNTHYDTTCEFAVTDSDSDLNLEYQNKFSKFHSFAYLDLRAVMLFNDEINECSMLYQGLSHEIDKSHEVYEGSEPLEVESPQLNRLLSIDAPNRDLKDFTEAYKTFNNLPVEPERPLITIEQIPTQMVHIPEFALPCQPDSFGENLA